MLPCKGNALIDNTKDHGHERDFYVIFLSFSES